MTDEEKKAIDILINEIADIVISEYCTHCKICENEDTECYYTKVIDIVYNLVQKQSKEIEELKKYKEGYKLLSLVEEQQHKIEKLINANDNLKKTKRIKNMEYVNQNYVSKDKIKEKIKELENQKRQWIEDRDNKHKDSEIIYAIEVLQSLIEKE